MQTAEMQEALRYRVCKGYPWLACELYGLEGDMGWGPGFRKYEGDGYPPPLRHAERKMQAFLSVFRYTRPDDVLVEMLKEALGKGKASRPCSWWRGDAAEKRLQEKGLSFERRHARCIELLKAALDVQEVRQGQKVLHLYAKIANANASIAGGGYLLGGARLYRDQWQKHQRYDLAVAGLVWLMGNSFSRKQVRAWTILHGPLWEARMHAFIRQRAQAAQARQSVVEAWTEPVPQQQQLVHVTCHI